jgi:hypothetical protein
MRMVPVDETMEPASLKHPSACYWRRSVGSADLRCAQGDGLKPSVFRAIRDNVLIQFALLLGFALVLNREGNRVPGGNEQVYLLYLVKAWHARFLATDWTFQEPTAGHPVFNFVFGWPTLFMSVEALAWIGRLTSWTAVFAALMRIGRQFRIPSWLAATGILLWLIQRQSFVSNEWIIGTFEAKCAAYACLLWAIDSILRGRVVVPAVLTGLAFTFHSAVGLWGGAAVALAFLSLNPIKTSLKFTAWAALAALPGAITTLKLVFGGHAISPDEARYLVLSEMPFHLDPFTFGTAKIAVMYMMLLFNWMHARGEMLGGEMLNAEYGMLGRETLNAEYGMLNDTSRERKRAVLFPNDIPVGSALRTAPFARGVTVRNADPTGRLLSHSDIHHSSFSIQHFFLIRFQLITGLFFAGGIVFRLLGKFSLVELFPFRVFAVTVMLFFFWHLAAAYWRRQQSTSRAALAALGTLTFFCLPGPVARLQGLAADQLPKWRGGDDDFRAAAKWVRDHTPEDAMVIAPPWRKDAFYFTHHPLVADWHAPRYDAMTHWRQRIEALVGDVSHMNVEDNLAGEMDLRARDHYTRLSPADLSAITRRYGGDMLITEGRYDYPSLFSRGTYTVYQLHPPAGRRSPGIASVVP